MATLSKKSEIDRISTMNNLLLLDGGEEKATCTLSNNREREYPFAPENSSIIGKSLSCAYM
jgi:hypothetical protein